MEGVIAEEEVINMVDIMDILMLETRVTMVEEECSFMLILEDFPMVMVVIILAEDIHHKCKFIRHNHITNPFTKFMAHLLVNLVTILLFAKFFINLVILLMYAGIGTLKTMYLHQGVLVEEKDQRLLI